VASSIIHVAQPTSAGVGRHVLALVSDQLERGFDVALASPSEGDLPERARELGARHLPWTASRSPGPATAFETAALWRVLGAAAPDLVHLHSSKAGLAGRLVLRGRRPTIFQPHGWSFDAVDGLVGRAALAWERAAARWADVLVCVSEGEQRRGEEAGIDARFRVIRNGVDLEEFAAASEQDREEARRRLGLATGEPLVVCIGRLARAKGQDVLLKAWPAVRGRVPDAKLVLVGGVSAADGLRLDASPGVELVGERRDVADWLAAADVVAQPSRWEGMALVPLEAMARARSVVVTDVPGTGETLADARGAVVPVEEPGPLADAIAARLLDPQGAAAEGRENRRRAERFDVRLTAAAFVDVYRELLAERPSEKRGRHR
jgi:glycosyltransferase involved in cell wall biosynthesis